MDALFDKSYELDRVYEQKSVGTGHISNYSYDRISLLENFISQVALYFPYCNIWIGAPITGYSDEYDKQLKLDRTVGLYITNTQMYGHGLDQFWEKVRTLDDHFYII